MKQLPKIQLKSYALLIVFSLMMVLMVVAVIGTQLQKDNRSRASYPTDPTNTPVPACGVFNPCGGCGTRNCGGNEVPQCDSCGNVQCSFAPRCSAPGPTNTPGPVVPTNTPGPAVPTNTPAPGSCTIQGFKVVMPNNQNIEPAKSQKICNDDPSHCTNAQPYSFVTSPGNHTVTFVVPPNFGYLVSSSLCYNNITCHNLPQPTPGAFTTGSSRAIVCPANGYTDLWWHIERDPALCPRHKEGDSNCDGSIDGVDYSLWLNSQCYPEIAAGEVCKDYRSDYNDDGKVYDDDYRAWFKCRRTTQCTP